MRKVWGCLVVSSENWSWAGPGIAQLTPTSQQILGSCSPVSMSTIRKPPTVVFINTLPGWSATTSPMIADSWPRLFRRMLANIFSASSALTMAISLPSLAT